MEGLGNKIKSAASTGAKLILRKYKKIIMIVIAIIFALVLIIPAGAWFIFSDDGEWGDDDEGAPIVATESATVSGYSGIATDKETIKEEGLKRKGYSEKDIENMTDEDVIEVLNMENKLNRKISSLDECTDAEIMWCLNDRYSEYLDNPEQLSFLLNAQLVSQYPKIQNLSEGKLNGIIEFKRVATDNAGNSTESNLTYIDNNSFNSYFEKYKNQGTRDIFKYFTLDDEGNVVIAVWSEELGEFESNNSAKSVNTNKIAKGHDQESIKEYDSRYVVTNDSEDLIKASYSEYSIEEKKINYKSMVQNYTLPFEYLWVLLVQGESYDFVEGLAQLVYDSEITIGIYDSVTTTVTVNKKEYTENFRERSELYKTQEEYLECNYNGSDKDLLQNQIDDIVSNSYTKGEEYLAETDPVWDGQGDKTWNEESYMYYDQHKQTIRAVTNNIELVYANTWISKVSTEMQYTTKAEPQQASEEQIDDENWQDNGSKTEGLDTIKETQTENRELTREKTKEELESEKDKKKTEKTVKVDVPFIHYYNTYQRKEIFKEKKTTNQKSSITTDITSYKYDKAKTEVIEKTDTDENTDNNFVKLLKADSTAYIYLTDSNISSWLQDMLESNDSTANMVDLTFYLLNKAAQTNKFKVDNFNFSDIFSPSDSNNIEGGSYKYGESLEKWLNSWECANPPVNADGDRYLVYGDFTGRLAVGYGVDLGYHQFIMNEWEVYETGKSYNNCPEATNISQDNIISNTKILDNAGLLGKAKLVAVNEGSINYMLVTADTYKPISVDKLTVDSCKNVVINSAKILVEDTIMGVYDIKLKQYQKEALIAFFYNVGATQDKAQEFAECYNKYWKESDDEYGKTVTTEEICKHKLYTEFFGKYIYSDGKPVLISRRQSEWLLFKTGYYDRGNVGFYKEATGLIRPVSDDIKVTSPFGPRSLGNSNHGGTDYGCPTGTEIYATMDGIVVDVVNKFTTEGYYSDTAWQGNGGMDSYGNYVIIRSANGKYQTLYAHCSKVNVSKNDTIKQGQIIAYSGNTGNSTGPHLHFELQLIQSGSFKRVNAELYINTEKLKEEGYIESM